MFLKSLFYAAHPAGCGVNEKTISWMDKIQNSAVEEEEPQLPPPPLPLIVAASNNNVKPRKTKKVLQQRDFPQLQNYEETFSKYSKQANDNLHQRHKRATQREENKNTCSLYIQTDPLIWKHIREGFPEHTDPRKENEVNEKTKEEILSLIAHHVTAVNYIYRDTRFDGRSEHRNIKFEVQRIKVGFLLHFVIL